MRRDIGLLLAGLGTLLIVVAVLFPTYAISHIIKFPLNTFENATLTGTNVQYFSQQSLTEETGVTVHALYRIKGDAKAGNSSTAVWDEVQYSTDVTNGQQQAFTTRRAAFDRRTAQLVNCCGANIDKHMVRQSGIVGWVFPFGTQKQTYQVFDTTLNKPMPFVFSGTDTTDGVATYKFVEDVPATQFATLTVPGYFVGSSAKTIDAPEFYQTHVIYWVDPETGALLNVNNFEELTIRNPATGALGPGLYKGDLVMTAASLQNVVNLDKNGRNELFLLETVVPIAFGIVGAVLLIVGIVYARKFRSGTDVGTIPPLSAMAPPAAGTAASASDHIVPGMDRRGDGRSVPTGSASATETSADDPTRGATPDLA